VKRIWIVVVLLVGVAWAAADELAIFSGEATVPLAQLNVDAAKAKATQMALAEALQQALRHIAPPEELELKEQEIDKRILKSPKRFVASFTILQADEEQTNYHLVLEARIRVDALREEVRSIVVVDTREQEKPQLLLLTYHRRPGGYAFDGELSTALAERFDLANQKPLPPRESEALLSTPSFTGAAEKNNYQDLSRAMAVQGIRLLVLAEVEDRRPEPVKKPGQPVEPASCDRLVRVKLIDADQSVLVQSFSYQYPAENECAKHTEEVARGMFGRIMDAFTGHGLIGESGDSAVQLEILGVGDYSYFQELQALIRNRPYVQKAQLSAFESGGRVTFEVVYGGPIQQLQADLENARATSFHLSFIGRRGNHLQYQLEL